MKRLMSFFAIFCLSAGFAFAEYGTAPTNAEPAKAGGKTEAAPKTSSAEFERIKGWEGKWEGTSTGHGGDEKVSVEYHVTSGGTAVEEKLFAGSPHEMVSIYYEGKNGKVGMTHFCMLGNRPHLEVKNSDASKMDFDWVPGGGVDPNELHMHSLSIATVDATHITQTWTAFKDGKPMDDRTVISLTKVSA